MTAKYPSVRRRAQASALTLSFLLAFGATPAAAEEAPTKDAGAGAAVAVAAAGAVDAADQADGDVNRGDVIIVTARRRQETAPRQAAGAEVHVAIVRRL